MKKPDLLFACGIAALLVLTGLSAFTDFFSLDEPNLLWELRRGKAWEDYYPRFITEGRPLYGIIQMSGLAICATAANLKYLRLVSLVLTILSGLMLYAFFRKRDINARISQGLVVCMFSLPGFTVVYGWAQAFPNHLSFMLSFFCGALACRMFANRLGDNVPTGSAMLTAAGIIIMQVISLLNYQGMALSFLLPAFFTLLLKNEQPARNRWRFLAAILCVFVISLGIYYQVYKSMLYSSGLQMTSRGKISVDFPSKIAWFKNILVDASQLHLLLLKKNIFQYTLSLVVALFILRDLAKARFLDTVFLLVFSLLLFLPHLLIEESWTASRNFALISILFIFFLFLRVSQSLPRLPVSWAQFAGLGCIGLMYFNFSEGYVKAYRADCRFAEEFVNTLPPPESGRIRIAALLPSIDLHEKYSPLKHYYDEFNLPVFFSGWPIEPALKNLYIEKYPRCSPQQIQQLISVKILDSARQLQKGDILLNCNYK